MRNLNNGNRVGFAIFFILIAYFILLINNYVYSRTIRWSKSPVCFIQSTRTLIRLRLLLLNMFVPMIARFLKLIRWALIWLSTCSFNKIFKSFTSNLRFGQVIFFYKNIPEIITSDVRGAVYFCSNLICCILLASASLNWVGKCY
jgi:hypothetical protein